MYMYVIYVWEQTNAKVQKMKPRQHLHVYAMLDISLHEVKLSVDCFSLHVLPSVQQWMPGNKGTTDKRGFTQ